MHTAIHDRLGAPPQGDRRDFGPLAKPNRPFSLKFAPLPSLSREMNTYEKPSHSNPFRAGKSKKSSFAGMSRPLFHNDPLSRIMGPTRGGGGALFLRARLI